MRVPKRLSTAISAVALVTLLVGGMSPASATPVHPVGGMVWPDDKTPSEPGCRHAWVSGAAVISWVLPKNFLRSFWDCTERDKFRFVSRMTAPYGTPDAAGVQAGYRYVGTTGSRSVDHKLNHITSTVNAQSARCARNKLLSFIKANGVGSMNVAVMKDVWAVAGVTVGRGLPSTAKAKDALIGRLLNPLTSRQGKLTAKAEKAAKIALTQGLNRILSGAPDPYGDYQAAIGTMMSKQLKVAQTQLVADLTTMSPTCMLPPNYVGSP